MKNKGRKVPISASVPKIVKDRAVSLVNTGDYPSISALVTDVISQKFWEMSGARI